MVILLYIPGLGFYLLPAKDENAIRAGWSITDGRDAVRDLRLNRDDGRILSNITCFALDMDGTVYLGEKWIDGAMEFLRRIKQSGRRYVFLTNNSSKSAAACMQKLERMGLRAEPDELITSGQATIDYLKRRYPGKRVYLLGNGMLKDEFESEGVILDENAPEVLVTAFDTSLTYEKLCKVCDLLRSGLPFVATHPDFNCPVENGSIPDLGSFNALFEASTGRRPDKIIGKPNGEIIDYFLKKTGCVREHTAIAGDRMNTDIAAGCNNGLTSVLVLSGETKYQNLQHYEIQPHLIFESVKYLIPFL